MRGAGMQATRMARELSWSVGVEVVLARTNLGLTATAAARLAGVAPETQRRVEAGDPSVGIDTICQVASAVGLKVWAKAFPNRTVALRDTGQLVVAEYLRSEAHAVWQADIEHRLGTNRAIDVAFFGANEIIATEIERMLADLQAQYRAADAKRATLADSHQRPVRLVLAVDDTRRNRSVVAEHSSLIHAMLPAGSREILAALRTGSALGRDGLLWVRRPPGR